MKIFDKELDREIKKIEEFAKNTKGRKNEYAVDEWVDRLHSSVYQSAAHSMSAVGMLVVDQFNIDQLSVKYYPSIFANHQIRRII